MSAIDHLVASDSLLFPGITYNIGAAPGMALPFCKPKTPGRLAFTLRPIDVGLPDIPLDIHFNGVVSGNSVVWSVDESPDLWWSGIQIQRVRGQLVTRVDDIPPRLLPNCSGATRAFAASLATVGAENALTVETSLGSRTLTDITTTGVLAGETVAPVFFDVGIHADRTPHTECGDYYQELGSTVRFTAHVANIRASGTVTGVTYLWDIPANVTVLGPRDGATLQVRFDSPGAVSLTVRATVQTNIDAGTQSGAASFAVLTEEEARLRDLACSLRQVMVIAYNVSVRGVGAGFTLGGRRFVDPLWDPSPEGLSQRLMVIRDEYSAVELRRAGALAQRIATAAQAVAKQATHVLAKVEARKSAGGGKAPESAT